MLAACAACGPLQDETYLVEVSGTKGVPFSGTCMVIGARGTSSNMDAAGAVPRAFQAKGIMVSCSVQNQRERGTLALTIKRARGQVVASSTTAQPYGVALAVGQ